MTPHGRNPNALQFRPILKQTIWGGRRLGERLGKPIGPGSDYAESWEVVDHGADQSVVRSGPLVGATLTELVREKPDWLLGPGVCIDRFPLLLKYLDCNRVLSVQVHPDDAYARQMKPPDLGKTEAWYIVESQPESLIYAGLQRGVDRSMLAEAIQAGRTEEMLHAFHPDPGDCLFIPAGTVHALGAGLLVCEIQQSSDTTFRLFDWDRVDAGGKGRPLHLSPSLEVTDYDSGPVSPSPVDRAREGWQTLVACDKFVLRSLAQGNGPIGGDGRFHLLTVPDGQVELSWPEEHWTLRRGETVLVPAGADAGTVTAAEGGILLAMHLP